MYLLFIGPFALPKRHAICSPMILVPGIFIMHLLGLSVSKKRTTYVAVDR